MKLIDILVEELPKRGGWPDGKGVASNGPENTVIFHELGKPPFWFAGLTFTGKDTATKEEYEAALAAIKQGWNGDGIPPVGYKCEYTLNNGGTWHECTVEYLVGTQGAVLSCDVYEGVQYVHFCNYDGKLFRPIRSEADKKRSDAVIALSRIDPQATPFEYGGKHSDGSLIGPFWYELYDAIAAGKIPHIRID